MDLSLTDIFLLITRWVHAVSAVAWVGGSILFALVLRPAMKIEPEAMRRVMAPITRYYREMVDIAVVAILFSGIILTLDRLTDRAATTTYGVVLGVKIALALVMFYQVWNLRQSPAGEANAPGWLRRASWLIGYNALVALGVIVYLLANTLAVLFDNALRAGR